MPTAITTTQFRYELIADEDIVNASAIYARCAWDDATRRLYTAPLTLTMDVLPSVFVPNSMTVVCTSPNQLHDLIRRISAVHFHECTRSD